MLLQIEPEVAKDGAYAAFLSKKAQMDGACGFPAMDLPDFLFPFQRSLVEWALQRGRAAIFADCGLGKTPMQLVWADEVRRHVSKPVLILTPLAVGYQTESEAVKFGIEAAVSRDGQVVAPITITNYERLHLFDCDQYGGVVCDESSAIKSFDGARRALVTDFMRRLPYRLLCTATAAPNDYIELGTSSEALGYLGYMDMLGRFFKNDQNTSKPMSFRMRKTNHAEYRDRAKWRFKGHAEESFWRWVSSWARAMRKPSDLGFEDADFVLPPLELREHVVKANRPAPGMLFEMPAVGLREEREELRRTINERCELVASILSDADRAVAWCHLNDEGKLLASLIDGAVEVAGSESAEAKEEKLIAFSAGQIRVLVTKPKIGAWGMNWQHCNRMTFFPSHSYEQYYQAIRRSWRFGQARPVTVDLITTEGGASAMKNLERKSEQAGRMFDALTRHMRDALTIRRTDEYDQEVKVPEWAMSSIS